MKWSEKRTRLIVLGHKRGWRREQIHTNTNWWLWFVHFKTKAASESKKTHKKVKVLSSLLWSSVHLYLKKNACFSSSRILGLNKIDSKSIMHQTPSLWMRILIKQKSTSLCSTTFWKNQYHNQSFYLQHFNNYLWYLCHLGCTKNNMRDWLVVSFNIIFESCFHHISIFEKVPSFLLALKNDQKNDQSLWMLLIKFTL